MINLSGKNNPFYGKKHTPKTRQRISFCRAGNRDLSEYTNEIIELYQKGLTSYQIAEKLKVSRSYITTTLKRNGIKLRQGGKLWIKGQIPWNKNKKSPQTSGKNNGNYKGGISPLNQRIRHCLKYKKWIEDIFIIDNWTCQKCGQRGGNLEADHYPKKFCDILKDNNIKSLEEAENCEELWNLNNGRTVCLKCHNRTKQVRSRFKKLGIT